MSDTLEKKVQEVLLLRVDAGALGACVETAGVKGEERVTEAQLRSMLEERSLEEARSFVAMFDAMRASIDTMDDELEQLTAELDGMTTKIEAAVGDSAKLLEGGKRLGEEKTELQAMHDACRALSERFQLSPDEERTLASGTVNKEFLAVLDHAKRIRDDARGLLQTNHHRLGIAVMTKMSSLVEDSLWKVSHWVRAQLGSADALETLFDAEDSAAMRGKRQDEADGDDLGSSMLVQCLRLLRNTEMYAVCLDEVAANRGKPIMQSFLTALTIGTAQARPIEMHAHDPVRFVGDMLAWLHQTVASEFEVLSALFGESMNGKSQKQKQQQQSVGSVSYVLPREFEGVCRPFKVRVDQALAQKTATTAVLFRVAGLLSFYHNVIGDLLTEDSPLPVTIDLCEQSARAKLAETLRSVVHRLELAPPVPPQDLQPPLAVRQTVALIAELVSAAGTMLVLPSKTTDSSASKRSSSEEGTVEVEEDTESRARRCASSLDAAAMFLVEPLLGSLEHSAATKLDETSLSVYMINCLSSILVAVSGSPQLHDVAVTLGEHIDEHVQALIAQQCSRFLGDCGLAPKLAILSQLKDEEAQQQQKPDGGEKKPQQQLSSVLGLEPRAIESAVRAFESSLLDISSSLVQSYIDRLLNPRYCSMVRRGVASLVSTKYATLYAAVTDPASGYPENGARVFHYAPEQVSVMLDVC